MMWIESRNKLKIIFDDQTRYLFQLQGISLYILYKEWIIAITQVIFKCWSGLNCAERSAAICW